MIYTITKEVSAAWAVVEAAEPNQKMFIAATTIRCAFPQEQHESIKKRQAERLIKACQ